MPHFAIEIDAVTGSKDGRRIEFGEDLDLTGEDAEKLLGLYLGASTKPPQGLMVSPSPRPQAALAHQTNDFSTGSMGDCHKNNDVSIQLWHTARLQ
jgi:hypothetical protein